MRRPGGRVRWLMLGIVTLGTILNYLARATLSVAAPTLKSTLAISTQQYSWIVIAFQGAYAAMQPVAGLVLDRLGTRLGLAIFAVAWSFATMAHALAGGWRSLALARGVLGIAEAASVPAGVRVASAWFVPEERSVAIGWFSIAAIGNIIAPAFVAACILWWGWQSAFIITGIVSLGWAIWWYAAYRDPADSAHLSTADHSALLTAQRSEAGEQAIVPTRMEILRSRRFWGIALPRFFAEPTWQTLNFFIPLYLVTAWHADLRYIALVAWLPFVGADLGVVTAGYLSPILMRRARLSLLASRKLVAAMGAAGMVSVACIGLSGSADVAIALFCIGAFMHQMIAAMLVTLTADLFPGRVVGTATGMAGSVSWTGGLIFTAVIGSLADLVGYEPLFVLLMFFDIIGVGLLFALLQPHGGRPAIDAIDHRR